VSSLPEPAKDRFQELDPEQESDSYEGEDDSGGEVAESDQRAQGGEDPDDSRGSHAHYRAFTGENDASAEESNAGDHLG
jgi:hypothetical protein